MPDLRAHISLRLQDYPELVAKIRSEVVGLILEVADEAEAADEPHVARRLREIAYEFDAGLRHSGEP